MPARYSKFFRAIHITGDAILLNFSFLLVNTIYYKSFQVSLSDHYVKQFLYINLFWFVSATTFKVYDIYRVIRLEEVFSRLLQTFVFHILLIFAFVIAFKEYIYSYKLFASKYVCFVFLLVSWRVFFLYALKFFRKHGLNFRRVIIIGAGPIGEDIYDFFLQNPEHGYKFLGFFDNNQDNIQRFPHLVMGSVEESKAYALKNMVDEIYVSLPDMNNDVVHDLIEFADKNLIRVKLLPDFRGFLYKRVEINFYNRVPIIMLRKEPLENPVNRVLKRSFDIAFSLFVLVFIFPWLFLIIAGIIKITSPGPVFFRQLRSGKDNRPFTCYKFRSMSINSQADQIQAQRDDPRITRIGRFLRKTNLDELPQFINVLMGHMSVVGPRPHMLKHTEEYSKIIDKFMVRHFVKPGITGLAQAKGLRGQTSDPQMMHKRVQMDVFYIENWSLFLDIKIIMITIWKMFTGDKNAF